MDKEILLARRQIDKIDKKIADLCLQRLLLAKKVLHIKKNLSMSSVDKSREKEILKLYNTYLSRDSHRGRVKEFVKSLMKLNPRYPQKTKGEAL